MLAMEISHSEVIEILFNVSKFHNFYFKSWIYFMRTRKIRINFFLNYDHFILKFYDIQNILTCVIFPVL